MIDSTKILQIKHIEESIEEAKNNINLERSGKQLGLYCRFNGINRGMLKYWRFGQVTLLAGMSSGGKSTMLNMLEDDFTNKNINEEFDGKVIILGFKYEMTGADEVLRNISGKMETSYSNLLSAEYIKDDIEGKAIYNNINDEQYENISVQLDKLKDRPIYYVESAGNLSQLYETYKHLRLKNSNCKFIITIDHTLLSKKLNEKTDLELMQNTGFLAIRLRKEGCMVLLIGQLNGNIEDNIRRENPNLHYPIKTDVHCGNQIFWACDNVLLFHRPELLKISKYGTGKKDTKRLVHIAFIKSRFGKTGNIWLQENFAKGRIDEFPKINGVS